VIGFLVELVALVAVDQATGDRDARPLGSAYPGFAKGTRHGAKLPLLMGLYGLAPGGAGAVEKRAG
jgi:hypothetical protein